MIQRMGEQYKGLGAGLTLYSRVIRQMSLPFPSHGAVGAPGEGGRGDTGDDTLALTRSSCDDWVCLVV